MAHTLGLPPQGPLPPSPPCPPRCWASHHSHRRGCPPAQGLCLFPDVHTSPVTLSTLCPDGPSSEPLCLRTPPLPHPPLSATVSIKSLVINAKAAPSFSLLSALSLYVTLPGGGQVLQKYLQNTQMDNFSPSLTYGRRPTHGWGSSGGQGFTPRACTTLARAPPSTAPARLKQGSTRRAAPVPGQTEATASLSNIHSSHEGLLSLTELFHGMFLLSFTVGRVMLFFRGGTIFTGSRVPSS